MADINLRNYLADFVTPERLQKFERILKNRTKHFTVVLEDVYQMHNTSAVIRSCEVFGIQEAHAIEVHNKNKIDNEIAMGAQKWVNLNYHNSQEQCLRDLRDEGYQIIATTPHKDSCYLSDFDISKKSALFFGSEKDGVSEKVMKSADGFLKIPMVGFTESLNISVSAAIILQSLTNRLKKSDVNWQLTKEEKLHYEIEWMKKTARSIKDLLARYEETSRTKF